jgi:protein-disulfide isomerase
MKTEKHLSRTTLIAFGALIIISGCATSEQRVREVIKKNPSIVFETIEENPEKFIDVVNRAAQNAQQRRYEAQAAQAKVLQENDLKNPKSPALDPQHRLNGSTTSQIVVVEYADFQCPACRMAYESLREFQRRNPGQVQFYYKHMPLDFHKMALPAALYFEAIRRQSTQKAFRFYEYLFENQRQLSDAAFLQKAAARVGADLKRLEADMKSNAVRKVVSQDMAEFRDFGFTGTPVIIINGVALHGAQPVEELERIAALTTKN